MLFNTTPSRKFSAGEHEQGVFRADRLNLALEEIDSIKRMLANMLPLLPQAERYTSFLGEIVDTPEYSNPADGQPFEDFGDPRYYVRRVKAKYVRTSGQVLTVEDDDNAEEFRRIVVATNLAEVEDKARDYPPYGTHLLPRYTPVHVYAAVAEKDGTPAIHYHFCSAVTRRFPAKITGAAQDSTNLRWKYAWSEYEKTTSGYGGWTVKSGGRSGTTTVNPAYSMSENINGSSGTFGNGVASTNLVGTFTVIRIPDNSPVMIEVIPVIGGDPEYWITGYVNGIDGACPA